MARVWYTAVHWLEITAGRVESFLTNAEALATLLDDSVCARKLTRLREETRSVTEEFGRNENLFEMQCLDKRKEITARRAELDRIETAAWEATLEEDR